jgi:hypothetical protein
VAKRLVEVVIWDGQITAVLEGMALAQFPEKIATTVVNVQSLCDGEYSTFGQSPGLYSDYVRRIEIECPRVWIRSTRNPHAMTLDNLRARLEHNEPGYHVKSYSPGRIAVLSGLLTALDVMRELRLVGCRVYPRLRFCNGCNNIFVQNVANIKYPQLTKLHISQIYVSGGRLRKFLKLHSDTISSIHFHWVKLTDGSWRLAKFTRLDALNLLRLYQKAPGVTATEDLPSHLILSGLEMIVKGTADIEIVMELWVRYFRTQVADDSLDGMEGQVPTYYQPVLFQPEDTIHPLPEDAPQAKMALLKYVEDVLGPDRNE